MNKEIDRNAILNNTEETYLTVREVTSMFKISRTFLYQLTKEGRIPAYKIGKALRYKSDDVDNLPVLINQKVA